MKLKLSSISILLVLVVYLLLTLCIFPPDTFFTCDSGMKYLQVFYLVENGFRSDGIPYAGRSVDPEEKYFPVLPPFAYRVGGPTYPQYPLLFAVLSALPYIIFGFRGLFLIPVFSTVVSAAVLHKLLALVGVGDERKRAFYVLFYCFGTPVFFYSLLFWEHTFCVMLLLSAVYFICRGMKDGGARWCVAAGLLVGVSIWTRFDSAVYFAACIAAVIFTCRRRVRVLLNLSIPAAAAVLLLFLFNAWYYGRTQGPHLAQVMRAGLGPAEHLFLAASLLFAPLSGLLVMCPFMLITAAWRTLWRGAPVRFIYLTTVISVVLVLLTTYNDGGRQWGPRYLLPVLPLGVVLLAVAYGRGGRALRRFIGVIVAASVCISFLGVWSLYRRKAYDLYPAISWIKSCGCDSVVFPSTYAVLEMAAAFPEKTYFQATGFGDFLDIAYRLSRAGRDEVASCKWEEGSYTELYERRSEHRIESAREALLLEREERFPASRDYTLYRWKMTREEK